jgi:hypothetical protein
VLARLRVGRGPVRRVGRQVRGQDDGRIPLSDTDRQPVGDILDLARQVVRPHRADMDLVGRGPERRIEMRPERVVTVAKADIVFAGWAVVAKDDGLRDRAGGPQGIVAVREHRARRDDLRAALGDNGRRTEPEQADDVGSRRGRGRQADRGAGAIGAGQDEAAEARGAGIAR